MELPVGHVLEAGGLEEDHVVIAADSGEALVWLRETGSTLPVTDESAGWLIDSVYGPTTGRPVRRGPCRVEREGREGGAPTLLWLECEGVPGALVEHTDGALLYVGGTSADAGREVARSFRPRRSPSSRVSDGWSSYAPAEGRGLIALRRGPNEGFVWIPELAPPGRRELSLVIADAASAPLPEGPVAKVTFHGRPFRAVVDGIARQLVVVAHPECDPSTRIVVQGSASTAEGWTRLYRIVASSRPDPSATCRLTQPTTTKSDGTSMNQIGPWSLAAAAVVSALLAASAIVHLARKRKQQR